MFFFVCVRACILYLNLPFLDRQPDTRKGKIHVFDAFPKKGPNPIITIFDNLVCYTCINVQFNEQTHKTVCTINISKINNVQTVQTSKICPPVS